MSRHVELWTLAELILIFFFFCEFPLFSFYPGRHVPVPYLGGPEGPEPALGGGAYPAPSLRIVVRSSQQAPLRWQQTQHWQPRAEPHSLHVVPDFHAAGISENALS